MKKVILMMAVGMMTFSMAGNVFAGMYFSGNLEFVALTDADIKDTVSGFEGEAKYDAGYGISLALGNDTATMRYEGEFAFRINDMDKIVEEPIGTIIPVDGQMESWSLLGNIYHDFNKSGTVMPHVGLGAGFSQIYSDTEGGAGHDDVVFAYQFMLGCGFKLSESMTLDIGYRYFEAADPTLGDTESEYLTHNLRAGLRVAF